MLGVMPKQATTRVTRHNNTKSYPIINSDNVRFVVGDGLKNTASIWLKTPIKNIFCSTECVLDTFRSQAMIMLHSIQIEKFIRV